MQRAMPRKVSCALPLVSPSMWWRDGNRGPKVEAEELPHHLGDSWGAARVVDLRHELEVRLERVRMALEALAEEDGALCAEIGGAISARHGTRGLWRMRVSHHARHVIIAREREASTHAEAARVALALELGVDEGAARLGAQEQHIR